MSVFITDYGLGLNGLIVAVVQATNVEGTSDVNQENISGALVQTVPNKPPNIPSEGLGTSDLQIVVDWIALDGDDKGQSTILNYELYWNGDDPVGAPDTYSMINRANALTYTKTPVTSGLAYRFKYKAYNKYGWGELSDYVEIKAAILPDTIATAIRTSHLGTSVKFEWDAPVSFHGATIDSYTIRFKKSDATFTTDITNCNGADTTIRDNLTCSVPMSVFLTYGLVLNDLIVATVEATNIEGTTPPNQENTSGALVRTIPKAPSASPEKGATTTNV
jgi:hypothetical protein